MLLVDTSVWIDYLRGGRSDQVGWFEDALEHDYGIGLTAQIYQEVLQGADSEASFARLDEVLSTQTLYEPLDALESHREAARIYFLCRRAGLTIRSTIDCLIARVAIEHDLLLLTSDRDFAHMASVLPELRLYSGPFDRVPGGGSEVHE
jgi:predicted nucleic acid-binding protein